MLDNDVDLEAKYRPLYEDAVNPFTLFSRAEKDKRYAQLNAADKLTLSTSRILLQHKYRGVGLVGVVVVANSPPIDGVEHFSFAMPSFCMCLCFSLCIVSHPALRLVFKWQQQQQQLWHQIMLSRICKHIPLVFLLRCFVYTLCQYKRNNNTDE